MADGHSPQRNTTKDQSQTQSHQNHRQSITPSESDDDYLDIAELYAQPLQCQEQSPPPSPTLLPPHHPSHASHDTAPNLPPTAPNLPPQAQARPGRLAPSFSQRPPPTLHRQNVPFPQQDFRSAPVPPHYANQYARYRPARYHPTAHQQNDLYGGYQQHQHQHQQALGTSLYYEPEYSSPQLRPPQQFHHASQHQYYFQQAPMQQHPTQQQQQQQQHQHHRPVQFFQHHQTFQHYQTPSPFYRTTRTTEPHQMHAGPQYIPITPQHRAASPISPVSPHPYNQHQKYNTQLQSPSTHLQPPLAQPQNHRVPSPLPIDATSIYGDPPFAADGAMSYVGPPRRIHRDGFQTMLPPTSPAQRFTGNIARRPAENGIGAIMDSNSRISTSSSVASAAGSIAARPPRRAPAVYPALLSRVAEAFAQRITVSVHFKDSLEYRDCFDGREAVDKIAFIIKTTDRNLALLLGRALDAQKLFHDVTYDHRLRDSVNELYKFTNLSGLYAAISHRYAKYQHNNSSAASLPPPSSSDAAADVDTDALPNGVFTLLTDCYSPTCTRDRLCYSIACPRRLEQQTRLNMPAKGGLVAEVELKRSLSRGSMSESQNQKLWIQSVLPEIAESVSSDEKKRQEVIYELIYTEKDFSADLDLLERLYMEPLRTTPIIPESRRSEFISKVFSNVNELRPISLSLSSALQARQKSTPVVTRIADIFLKHLDSFTPFVHYGSHQVYSKQALEAEIAANPDFVRFIETQERLPESRKLPIQSFLGRPTTRLGRYKLLLEAVLKFTADDNPDKREIPVALEKIKELLSLINVETGRNDNRLRLEQINERLVWKAGEWRDLKLLDEDRVLIRDGLLKKKTGVDAVEMTVFLLDNYLLLTKKKKGKEGSFVYRVHKVPIPLELLVLSADQEAPRSGARRASVFRHSGSSQQETQTGNASAGGSSSFSASTKKHDGLVQGRGNSSDAAGPVVQPAAGAKQGYPFSVTHLGKSGGVITLYATTQAERRQWKEKLEKQVESLVKRKKVFHMQSVCDRGFLSGNRILCAAVFDDNRRLAIGADDGIHASDPQKPHIFRRAIDLERVSQLEILEDFAQVIALAKGELFSYACEDLDSDELSQNKRSRKVASHVSFFRVGECVGRKLVTVVKSTGLSSTVKTFEPVAVSANKKKPSLGRLLMRGANDGMKVFKEFYIPTESTSIHFLKTKLCVGCGKGFEIVDLETLQTQGLLDPEDERLNFVLRRENILPVAIFRIMDGDFLLCYDVFAFYVNRSGQRVKEGWLVNWEGRPEAFALLGDYVLAFEPSFVEVRNVHTGALEQVITGNNLRFLTATPTEVHCVTNGPTPTSDQVIYRIFRAEDVSYDGGGGDGPSEDVFRDESTIVGDDTATDLDGEGEVEGLRELRFEEGGEEKREIRDQQRMNNNFDR